MLKNENFKQSDDFIIIKNLTKKFRKKIANNNISFTIKKGEKIGIIGANGAGKTTLVEQIIGVVKPTKGKIRYNFDYDNSPQEKMGMQFQDSSYPEGLTVKNIIDFSLDIYKTNIDKTQLQKTLDIFQMKKFYNKHARGLSGGQQQKLNVLLAIIHKPEIIILDEVSTGLDIEAKFEILNYVKKFIKQKNITLILISHNMDEISMFCKRIIVLSNGKIKMDLKIEDISKKYNSLNAFISNIIKKSDEKNDN